MANVEHSAITDPNRHEPKGASTATSGQVYVADGAGSGAWTTQTLSDNFSTKLFHTRTHAEAAAEISEATWVQRTISNSITNEIASASLSANQITLPAGTYYIIAQVPAHCVFTTSGSSGSGSVLYKSKLYNTTGAADLVPGSIEHRAFTISVGSPGTADITSSHRINSTIQGRFTLSGSSVLQVQSYWEGSSIADVDTTSTANDDSTFGSTVNITTDIHIWKIS